ncbi:uncharacterized protein METZ01_LOCUS370740, partial [marine metagenome]
VTAVAAADTKGLLNDVVQRLHVIV